MRAPAIIPSDLGVFGTPFPGWTTCSYSAATQGEKASAIVPVDRPAMDERIAEPPFDAPEQPGRRGSHLRQILTVWWTVGVVLFTLARFFVARSTLEEHGLNVWVFGLIDLVTAVPYALGVAFVVGAMVDHRLAEASRWAMIAIASFLAPYVYVAWAGRTGTFPRYVWYALAVLIVLFGGNAVRSVRRRVREGRAGRTEPALSVS